MFPYTEPTKETPTPDPNDVNPWHFLIGLAVALLVICGVPTLITVIGAYAIKIIWGL